MRTDVPNLNWQEIIPGTGTRIYSGAYYIKVMDAEKILRAPTNIVKFYEDLTLRWVNNDILAENP